MTPERFKEIRKEKKHTQASLADLLGVTRLTVHNWEKGTHTIPLEAETKMLELNGTIKAEDPGAFITVKNHPECFINDSSLYFSLAHPRWYISSDSPLRHLAPANLVHDSARVQELATHVAPTMERVVDLFIDNWPTAEQIALNRNAGWMHEASCKQYLVRRDRADLLHLIPHDSTNDARNARRAEPDPEAVAAFGREIEEVIKS